MLSGTNTMALWRPPAPAGGKVGALQQIGGPLTVRLQPASPQQVADVGGSVLYRSYAIWTVNPALPDVRVQDRLIDQNVTDPLTGQLATYLVRGVRSWRTHLEIVGERQVGA